MVRDFQIIALQAVLLLILAACAGPVVTSESQSNQRILFVTDDEEAVLAAAYDALTEAQPNALEISTLEGATRGYRMYWRFALDSYTTTLRYFRAEGTTAGGDTVTGYYVEVYGSGSLFLSGPATNRQVHANARRKLAAIGTGVAVRSYKKLSYLFDREGKRVAGSGSSGSEKNGDGGPKSLGTGFLVNGAHNLVTNNHVVAGCKELRVFLEGVRYPAHAIATDQANDIAVIVSSNLPAKTAPKFSSLGPRLGEDIMVVGYPLAHVLGTGLKSTTGNISGLAGLRDNVSAFQFTAPIQGGNSGGPVLDRSGAVIGIVSSKLREDYALAISGSLPQLVNFGVKSGTVRTFLEAHRIPVSVASPGKEKSSVEIAAAARDFTFLILCY